MATYNTAQLEKLWTDNGGPAEWAPTMAAVALAESGGSTTAKNPSGATGLWQTLMSAQSPAFQKEYGSLDLTNPANAVKVAIVQLRGGPGISNWTADPVGRYVTDNGSSPLTATQIQQLPTLEQSAFKAQTATTTGETGAVNIPKSVPEAAIAGANIKNFHGYDLTAFAGSPDLGNAEKVIENYTRNPTYKAQLDQKLATEYGYQTSWWKNIPQVNSVMLYAAQNLDPTAASAENTFQSLLANTQWWQTTTSNGRYWDEAYGTNGAKGTDPAQAQQALQNAQEKVLADANQIGVTLSKQQLDAIALTYAKNNYVASGSFGTASGTAAEWLDQAIIDTLENIQGQNVGKIPQNFSTLAPGTSDFTSMAMPTGTGSPTGLSGIASQLYSGFQQIAQQYLMYNPTNPQGSLLTNQSLLNKVESTLQNYTGSGSSFGSSNLINGAMQQFTEEMKTQASQLYPSLAASIAQGTTPQSYVQPYSQVISNTLGVAPGSIDFTSPQWNWVIATPDAKTGVKGALTLDQVQQKLTTMPQFDQSNNAHQMATDVTTSLSKQFGFGSD